MHKKIIYILSLLLFLTSCGTFDSIKRGLTGEKRQSSDEFLIKKKDPLILPPDFDILPTPDDRTSAEEISILEKDLETLTEGNSPETSSVEASILKKIQSK